MASNKFEKSTIALGIDDRKGSIKVNKDADLVILDDDMNVKSTIEQGKVTHCNKIIINLIF